jgi:hypothetical protein
LLAGKPFLQVDEPIFRLEQVETGAPNLRLGQDF